MAAKSSFQYLDLKDDLWYECLQNSYGFLRESWLSHWLGMPRVLSDCLVFLNLHENNFSKAARRMLDAAKSVALEIENKIQNQSKFKEPKYHNRLHYADALTAMTIQLAILAKLEKKANHDWTACALLTCIAHDFMHSGKVNTIESEIEKQSVNFLKPILLAHNIADEWQIIIETAIIRSDFSIVHHNHEDVIGENFEWNLKWLCVLLNEADVMASASIKYGPGLGESLSQERQFTDFSDQASVTSIEGRNVFLKKLLFSSPASLVLGLRERVNDEIRSLN